MRGSIVRRTMFGMAVDDSHLYSAVQCDAGRHVTRQNVTLSGTLVIVQCGKLLISFGLIFGMRAASLFLNAAHGARR